MGLAVAGLAQEAAAEVAYGVPDGEPAYGYDGDEDEGYIVVVDADGIGVDDEGGIAVAEAHEPELLLDEAEQEADDDTHHCTGDGNHATLEEEDAGYLAVGGAEIAEGDHIVFLVDDEHGERAHDVEARHNEDEGEEDVGEELLYLHDFEGVVLLLKAVLDGVAVAGDFGYLALGVGDVGSGLEAQFERGNHALLPEEIAGPGDGNDDVAGVVLGLLDHEEHAGRVERVDDKTLRGVGQVELTLSDGGIDAQRVGPTGAERELLGELYAHDAVVEVGGVEAEFAVAVENVGDAGEVAEIVVDTLDGYHRLLVLIYSQRIVLDTLGGNIHIRQLAYAGEQRVVGRSRLAFDRRNLYLRVKAGKQCGHQVVEAVEGAEHDDQRHRSHGDSDDRDEADDIDGVGTLLGKEIAPGDE